MKTIAKKLIKRQREEDLNLSPEVRAALKDTRDSITAAMDAVEKIEALYVTQKLSRMFWVSEEEVAEVLQEDNIMWVAA